MVFHAVLVVNMDGYIQSCDLVCPVLLLCILFLSSCRFLYLSLNIPLRKYCLYVFRREWDAYLAPENAFGASRIPDGEVSPNPPSSDLWASALVDSSDTDIR